MKTEKSKMIAGEMYYASDAKLVADRLRSQALCRELQSSNPDRQKLILADLIPGSARFTITAPFYCDYGYNITLGDNVYFNFSCVLLDVCSIEIGEGALIGPGVHIYTAMHPMEADLRRTGQEFGKPVKVGKDVWIGGGAIICPGVTIEDESVIGAGSVVTRDIPAGVFAAGNPCRVIRSV